MFYHSDCGHVIDRPEDSLMISEGGWKDYTHMYLGNCPSCGRKYPYLKYLDESVGSDVQEIIYRAVELEETVYVPQFQNPVETVRLVSPNIRNVDRIAKHERVNTTTSEGDDFIINLS